MQADRPALGIALMLLFCLLAPLADGLAKALGAAVPLAQVVAVRFVAQAVLVVPVALAAGRSLRLGPREAALVALRTALHVAGIALMFLALRHLPLADAIAIAYVMPFAVLLLGWAVLGERVGWRRLAACVAGFGGTLMVMQPSFDAVGWKTALPLAVAVIFAAFVLLTRHLAARLGPLEMQATGGLMGSAALLPALWLAQGSGIADLDPVRPDAAGWALLAGIGVLGTAAHLALTWALKLAPAATLAPMQYLEIPFAVAIGWALFADLPGPRAGLGIAIVTAAGLYVILRERALARSARPAAPPAPGPAPPAAG